MECVICASASNDRNPMIKCFNNCGFECCMRCFANQAKHSDSVSVSCMGCKAIYTDVELSVMYGRFKEKNTRRVADLIIKQHEHLLPLINIKAEKHRRAIQIDEILKTKRMEKSSLHIQLYTLKMDIYQLTEEKSKCLNYDVASKIFKM